MKTAKTATHDIAAIWDAAIAAVHPATLMQRHVVVDSDGLRIAGTKLPWHSFHKIYLIGVGKASAAMAVEVERILGSHLTAGLVTVKHGHALAGERIRILAASHPVPDESSVYAVAETLEFLKQVTEEDVVIFLLSGGASSLWCDIPPELRMQELSLTYDVLIRSGAPIEEINKIRKHLSLVKGGQLPRYCKGRLFSLVISDVPGDDLSSIGSAPTYPDTSTFAEALAILSRYDTSSEIPKNVIRYLENGASGLIPENPKPDDPIFSRVTNTIVGSSRVALSAAAKAAERLGYHVYLSDRLITGNTESEARQFVGQFVAGDIDRPCCFIQGGETVIHVTGNGKGGRNQHFALVALMELSRLRNGINADNVVLLSCGTDGTDGPTDAAGAIVSFETLDNIARTGIAAERYLADHDSYRFFQEVGGLVRTGPTQTNVMDIQMMIVV